jgi:gluconolactonase
MRMKMHMAATTLRAATRHMTAATLAALLGSVSGLAAAAEPVAPLAVIDLASRDGAASVRGTWRYSDTRIVPTTFRLPDAEGQPTGGPTETYDFTPRAGAAEFDDSSWPVLDPSTLAARRGHGRLSFNWYRLRLTLPEQVGGVAVEGRSIVLQVTLDDYAEVWVDGELARPFGVGGGSVIAGWNAPNRITLTRHAKAGDKFTIAVFGINGPISDTPTNYIFIREARLELHPGSPGPQAVVPQEVNVLVTRLDPALDAIVPPNTKLYKVADGFEFTEGPVWSRPEGALYFSDPNHNTMYRYSEAGTLSVFREHSGYDAPDIKEYGQPGSNGLTFDRQGRLVINEHGRHRVSRLEPDGRITVLADNYRGKRLNSPNDLVVKSDGSVYFTDPPFGLPKFFDDPRKELPYSGVYRWRDGRLTLLTTELKGPNGIVFTPDEQFLYVDNWDAQRKVVLRYPVRADGTLGPSTVFADMTAELKGAEALDGMKVDVAGNLYVSAPDGVRIYSPAGKHLGTVTGPKNAHNFAWGGADGRTLYLAALSGLYRLPLLVPGVRP